MTRLLKPSKIADLLGVTKKTAIMQLKNAGIEPFRIIVGKNGISQYFYKESAIIEFIKRNKK